MTLRILPRMRVARTFLAIALLGCVRPAAAPQPTPLACPEVPANVLRGITQIRAGGALTCAVADGKPYCWGKNDYGQVGDGFQVTRLRPTLVAGLRDPVEISPDTLHVFARDAGGNVWAWGRNDLGTFGDGSPDYHVAWEPLAVPGWGRVRTMIHGIPACAITEAGAVECAGLPRFRSSEEGKSTPKPAIVEGLGDVVSVTPGAGFTCVVQTSGQVLCWGFNGGYELGDGTREDRAEPRAVPGITDAVEVAAGSDTLCARMRNGTVKCWGSKLGGAYHSEHWLHPVTIGGIDDAVGLTVGYSHACALRKDGSVSCWGEASYYGQLGDGTADTRPESARPVRCVEDAAEVSAGDSHTCARLRDGTARCWGAGSALGDGTSEDRKLPVAVLSPVAATPAPDRCPPGTDFKSGPPDDEHMVRGEWCQKPDGKREGRYVSHWDVGTIAEEGNYDDGKREGLWRVFYAHGEIISENRYTHGEPDGVWVAYSLHHVWAFATCFDHGKRIWQISDAHEAASRTCP